MEPTASFTPPPFTPEVEAELRESFKRHSPETVEAIVRFRRNGDTSGLLTAVHGIMQRFIPAESAVEIAAQPDASRLIEDIGIDSLTMLEIVMAMEEAFGVRIDDQQAREIATIGDVRRYVRGLIGREPGG
jgi:3-hydroxyacyl-[acyl-carrier-protein] dehydratase